MAEKDKKYYWLKLKRDFFKRHDIRIIEKMPDGNGKEYVLFYLKLMSESVDHEGYLRFSESIPYSNEMLASLTDTNIGIVESAMALFQELGMVTIEEDLTIFVNGVVKLIGSETGWAEKKRKQRQSEDKEGTLSPDCPKMSSKCPIEKETDKDKEKESFYKGKKSKKVKEVSFDVEKAEEQAKENRADFGTKKNKKRTR